MDGIKMVEVTRSNFTESTHHGIAILINSNGEVLREWGNSSKIGRASCRERV